MLFYKPEVPSTPTDAERVEWIDQDAIAQFTAAFSAYALRLGTHATTPLAIYHTVGETGAVSFYTLHIQLAGVEQSLQVFLCLHEESLDAVDDFLEAEFDLLLEREDEDDRDCAIGFTPEAVRYSEMIPILADLEDVPCTVEVPAHASAVATVALSFYAYAARQLADCAEATLTRKLWTYSLVSGEPSEDAEPEQVFVVGVVEEQQGKDETRRATMRATLCAEDYHEFCVVLGWLCRTGGCTEFESLTHSPRSEEELAQVLKDLHEDEFAHLDAMLHSLPDLLDNILGSHDDAEQPATPKRTVH
jgi:hypothetical protein